MPIEIPEKMCYILFMDELIYEGYPETIQDVNDETISALKFFAKSVGLKEVFVSKSVLMDKSQIERLFNELGPLDIMIYDSGVAGLDLLKFKIDEVPKICESNNFVIHNGKNIFATSSANQSEKRELIPITRIIQRDQYIRHLERYVRKAELAYGGGLSPLERAMLIFTKIADFRKKEYDKENHQDYNSMIFKLAMRYPNEVVRVYIEACRGVGVPAVQQSYKLSYNDKHTGRKVTQNRKVAILFINDLKYMVDGHYFSDIVSSARNRKAGELCYFLMSHDDFTHVSCYNGTRVDLTYSNFDELVARSNLAQEKGWQEQLTDESVANKFNFDTKFNEKLHDLINQLSDQAYEMKSNDKSVEHFLHPYYGEGTMLPTGNFNNHYQEFFETLFKMNCENLTKSRLKANPYYNIFKAAFENAQEDKPKVTMAELAQRLKILSENYKGITPKTFTDTLIEGMENGDLFAGEGNGFDGRLFAAYKEMVSKNKVLSNCGMLNLADISQPDYLSYEQLVELFKRVMKITNVHDNELNKILRSVEFADTFEVGTRWNAAYLQSNEHTTFHDFANQNIKTSGEGGPKKS